MMMVLFLTSDTSFLSIFEMYYRRNLGLSLPNLLLGEASSVKENLEVLGGRREGVTCASNFLCPGCFWLLVGMHV